MATLKSSLALIVLNFALFLCFNGSTVMSVGSYKYFQFVLQWPPTLCRTKQCYQANPARNFSIHGLWPSNISYNPNSRCTGRRFDFKLSQTLEPQLKISWPNLVYANNTDFWKREWYKHGTCSEQTLDQRRYFTRSHDIWNQYNVLQILKNANIEPNGSVYAYTSIESSISTATKMTPRIKWSKLPRDPKIASSPLVDHLHEVVLCYEHDGVTPSNCPTIAQKPAYIKFA